VTPERRSARLSRARAALEQRGAEWLVVPPSADFRWLTGAVARSTERLVALALPRSGAPFCLVPRLEADALAVECPGLELVVWDEHERPLERLAARLGLEHRPLLLLGDGFRTAPLLALASRTGCQPATEVMAGLRAIKDADELAALEEAGRHADRVMQEAAEFLRPGLRETEVARFITERFHELGDTEPWALVASGPHSALPHHSSTTRALQAGEVVLLDLGAFTRGYGSDITRTFWLGDPPAEAERVHQVVNAAREAGMAAVRAGVPAQEVDRAARAVIERAGYGAAFTHRTGHGVGLEVHEAPWIVEGNPAPLAAGMVHSVEPGIYLPGRFGVRLEDLVVVESGGARALNHAPLDPAPVRVRG
jgi:Xaa-Pro aminopeptidase